MPRWACAAVGRPQGPQQARGTSEHADELLEQMERRRLLGLLEGRLQRRRPAVRREEAVRLLVRELVLATCSACSASLGRGGRRGRAGRRGVVKACVGLYSTLGDGQGPWNRRLQGRPTLGLEAAHWRGRPPLLPPAPHTHTHMERKAAQGHDAHPKEAHALKLATATAALSPCCAARVRCTDVGYLSLARGGKCIVHARESLGHTTKAPLELVDACQASFGLDSEVSEQLM